MKKFLIAILLLSAVPFTTKAELIDVDPLGEAVSSCIELSINMRYRMRDTNTNEGVSVLQDFLNAEGFLNVGPTGYFGTATLKAVKSFQSSLGISPTGFVGPLTRSKIKATTCGSTGGTTATTGSTTTTVTTAPTATTVPGCTSTIGYSPTTGRKCDSTTTVVDPEITLTANNVSDTLDIIENTSVTFSWNASNANSCSSSDGMSNWATSYKPTSGSVELKDPITVSRTYTITCRNSSGMSVSRSVRVNVKENQSTTPSITVLSPNGGEQIQEGATQTIIKWSTKNFSGLNVSIDLIDSTGYVTNIASNISNTGYYYWNTAVGVKGGYMSGYSYKIRISSNDKGPSAVDDSDSYFSIVAAGTVVTSAPTVEVIGTPTLSLQYDSARKESALVANYRVKITAGSQALSFPTSSGTSWTPLGFSFRTTDGKSGSGVKVTTSGSTSISAGSSANYDIRLEANPNHILAGNYYAFVDSYVYGFDPVSGHQNGIAATLIGNTKTNAVIVVGERAPYISSFNCDPAPINCTLYGVRFHSISNQVTINGVTKTLPSNAGAGVVIYFNPADFGITTSGVYSLQVSTSEGASNVVNVNVTVTPTTTTQPSITVTSPNGGEAWEIGNSYTIKWNQQNVDSVTIFLMRTSSLHGPTIASSYSVPITASTGSYTYTVPSNITLANTYKIWILGYKTGYGQANDWSDAPFGIVPVALGTTQPSSQFASVLGAFSQPLTNQTTSAPVPSWTYEWARNLEIGSPYAEDIIALQTALAKEGVYSVEISGGFYTQTYLAVKAFQEKYGIESTGFVGPLTRARLNELY